MRYQGITHAPRQADMRAGSSALSPLPCLRPYQAEVARAVLESVRKRQGLTFSVVVSRQGGKNELSAQLELLLLLANMQRAADGVKCAPTFHPQARISLRRLWSRVQGLPVTGLGRIEGGNCVRFGHARQFFLSAEPGANVVGHTVHLLLEVDEAQDVDPEKFDKDFRPMASTTNATTVYYGTPWTDTDLLAQVRHRHLELEKRDGIQRHFAFDWETVARYNPLYAAFVARERARLGETHPLFMTQYLLRPVAGGGRLFRPAQIALMEGAHPRESSPSQRTRSSALLGYVAGLDVGGEAFPTQRAEHGLRPSGPDWTVLTIARVLAPPPGAVSGEPVIEVVEQAAWQGAAHPELTGGLLRLLRDVWRVRRVVIDATGVGEGLAAALASALPDRGVDTSFGAPPRSALRIPRLEVVRLRLTEERKSALGHGLLAAVNGGRLRLYRGDGSPEYRELRRELELARAAYRPNRRLAWAVDPADGHDDFLMSLALAVEAARDLRPRTARGRVEGEGWPARA